MKNLSLVMLCLLLLCSCKADLPQEGSSPSAADEESLPADSTHGSVVGRGIHAELFGAIGSARRVSHSSL